jgi:protein tyrosine/serine phosphatase
MRAFRKLSVVPTSTLTIIIALAALSTAQTSQSDKTSNIQIKNFGCINEKFYRGAQPKEKDYADLAALGVKTVIDLQRDGTTNEQALVEASGMKFYRIPMSDKSRPSAEQAELFLKIVNDPENQPIFVHCAGGRHRTGAMSAIYRMTNDGWSADQAYLEMKHYDFEYGMGHTPLKHYVYDFYTQIEQKGLVVTTSQK